MINSQEDLQVSSNQGDFGPNPQSRWLLWHLNEGVGMPDLRVRPAPRAILEYVENYLNFGTITMYVVDYISLSIMGLAMDTYSCCTQVKTLDVWDIKTNAPRPPAGVWRRSSALQTFSNKNGLAGRTVIIRCALESHDRKQHFRYLKPYHITHRKISRAIWKK